MDFIDFDVPPTPAIRGGHISRARRMVWNPPSNRKIKRRAHRRLRRALRIALNKGDARDIPAPTTSWDIC